jgi:FADH2 O2-dependent halogenase
MESLDFTQPSIAMLEAALEYGIALGKGRVFADLWDLRRFSTCDACYDARAARLHEMNLRQVLVAPIECELSCRATGEPGGADFGGTYKIPQTTVAQPLRLPGRDSSRPPVSQIAPSAETSLGAADTSVCATFFSPSKPDFDLAIIGSGFAGSLLATIARRLWKSVILLESGKHPRFAIGESTTPLSNLLLEELATRYQLPNLLPLCKWGTWRRSHPELACGLKRGFTFYHHQPGCDPARENQLLVAASPRDEIADTHWYRADVDAFFAGEAQRAGVDYRNEVRLHSAREQDGGITLEGEGLAVTARFVVDATGPRGFLHRAFSLPEVPLPDMPPTEALYTHFTNVRRLDELHPPSETPPYPVDDAAVHHIFDGGWIWVLRFANGITSAGVAASFGLGQGETAWRTILDRFPTIRAQFAEAEPLMPFIHAPRVSFRSGAIAGRRWALLPSAAGFVDPLLSTGFPLTLLGVARLAEILERDWESPRFEPALLTYARQTEDELLATSRLIGSLYASMANFPVFVARSLLYFAAASFSETARRLGKPHLASSFLLHDNPRFQFQPLLKNACDADEIRRFIEPFNVAGLGDPLRRNWYPADAEDMLRAASKLGASRDELAPLLTRCGFQAVS